MSGMKRLTPESASRQLGENKRRRPAAAEGEMSRGIAAVSASGVPAHVPSELIFDFDIGADPDPTREPHAKALALHAEAPEIFFSPRYGGQWMVRSLDAARAVTQSPQLFSSGRDGVMQIPITLDPPEHDFFRSVLA